MTKEQRMKIIAFAGSNSSVSINRQLVRFAASYFKNDTVELLDLNDFEMPIYSYDREHKTGVPEPALRFAQLIDGCDLIMISLAEHNGAYSAAFKNVFDWVSRIHGRKAWADKPMFLLSTSTGARGGASVMEMAIKRFPRNGGTVIATFSLPLFEENFTVGTGIINAALLAELEEKIENVKKQLIL